MPSDYEDSLFPRRITAPDWTEIEAERRVSNSRESIRGRSGAFKLAPSPRVIELELQLARRKDELERMRATLEQQVKNFRNAGSAQEDRTITVRGGEDITKAISSNSAPIRA